jgi:hypothetical protein
MKGRVAEGRSIYTFPHLATIKERKVLISGAGGSKYHQTNPTFSDETICGIMQ